MHMIAPDRQTGPGRPRAFDRDAALEAALGLFWRQGYEAASLDKLTEAMGISRSSFYAAFGSKHAVLIAALDAYTARARAALAEVGPGAADLLAAIANVRGGPQGCLLVNCVTELAPHDPEVAARGREHLDHIQALFARMLSPEVPEAALPQARALTALALGALTLRKSGTPPAQIEATLAAAAPLLAPFS